MQPDDVYNQRRLLQNHQHIYQTSLSSSSPSSPTSTISSNVSSSASSSSTNDQQYGTTEKTNSNRPQSSQGCPEHVFNTSNSQNFYEKRSNTPTSKKNFPNDSQKIFNQQSHLGTNGRRSLSPCSRKLSPPKTFQTTGPSSHDSNFHKENNSNYFKYSSNVPYTSPPSPAPKDRYLILPPPITPEKHLSKSPKPEYTFQKNQECYTTNTFPAQKTSEISSFQKNPESYSTNTFPKNQAADFSYQKNSESFSCTQKNDYLFQKSPECYQTNTFPSPDSFPASTENFIPPPPLLNSPSESPTYLNEDKHFYYKYHHSNPHLPTERYTPPTSYSTYEQYSQYKFNTIGPASDTTFVATPNCHEPVERYAPRTCDKSTSSSSDGPILQQEIYPETKCWHAQKKEQQRRTSDYNEYHPPYRIHTPPPQPYLYRIRYNMNNGSAARNILCTNTLEPKSVKTLRCCQSYENYLRCTNNTNYLASLNRYQCSRSPSIGSSTAVQPSTPEYVGASGGRLISVNASNQDNKTQQVFANQQIFKPPLYANQTGTVFNNVILTKDINLINEQCKNSNSVILINKENSNGTPTSTMTPVALCTQMGSSGSSLVQERCNNGHVPICCVSNLARQKRQLKPMFNSNNNGQKASNSWVNSQSDSSSSYSRNNHKIESSPPLVTETLSSSTFPSTSSIESSPLLMAQRQTGIERSAGPAVSQETPTVQFQHPIYQRTTSLPASTSLYIKNDKDVKSGRSQVPQLNRSQSDRGPRINRTALSEQIKNFVTRQTANFFCVDEANEHDKSLRWLERRKRLAARAYGDLKDEYAIPSSTPTIGRSSTFTRGYTSSGATPREARDEGRPDVLPLPTLRGEESADVTDHQNLEQYETIERPTLKRKESVAQMTLSGLSYVVMTLTRQRGALQRTRPRPSSRSFPPEEVELAQPITQTEQSVDDDLFFTNPDQSEVKLATETDGIQMEEEEKRRKDRVPSHEQLDQSGSYVKDHTDSGGQQVQDTEQRWKRSVAYKQHRPPKLILHKLRQQDLPLIDGRQAGACRIRPNVINSAIDNSNRRKFGLGWLGKLFGTSDPIRKSVAGQDFVKEQLDDLEDHRPFFTWWVTTVQILVLIVSLICYGFGPFGFDLADKSGQVLVTSLSLQQVDYQEPANFWLGPKAADLIHLGAKFSPCMRRDAKILKEVEKVREKERNTACCIRNDDSGCVQSSKAECSLRGLTQKEIISTWKKWTDKSIGPGGRLSGSVCGLDPKFCDAPASVAPYEWPDDITKWPICRKTHIQTLGSNNYGTHRHHSLYESDRNGKDFERGKDKTAEHMACEIIGHPCCIGIHGQCQITTREYCDFVNGYFHEDASLCSQVSCMDDVCGMIPFYFPETPDQFYRLWMSMFLHAGVIHLLITVFIQYTLMRDLEKLTGSLRIAIIYFGSGIAGNLASAIFVPYRAEVGPAGAQFGLLACLIVEIINMWPMLRHPKMALIKLISITIFLFILGLLPWVDNFAHAFGFLFGFLLAFAFLPFISFGPYDREKKICLIWISLLFAAFIFTLLILLFYFIPVYDCEICSYFNCIPFTRDMCKSQNINFKRKPLAFEEDHVV